MAKAKSKDKESSRGTTAPRGPEALLTVAEVARLKGVTRSAVYAAITQGRLPYRRVLGRLGIRAGTTRAWQPVRWPGRPPGIPMGTDARRRISQSQKRRWRQRQTQQQAQPQAQSQ